METQALPSGQAPWEENEVLEQRTRTKVAGCEDTEIEIEGGNGLCWESSHAPCGALPGHSSPEGSTSDFPCSSPRPWNTPET